MIASGDDHQSQDGRPASNMEAAEIAADVAGKWTSKGNYMVGCSSSRYSYSVIIAFSNHWSHSFLDLSQWMNSEAPMVLVLLSMP